MITLVLDCCPPSLNSSYKKYQNRIVLSKEARAFKQLLAGFVTDDFVPLTGRLHLNVSFSFPCNRKRDIDNYLKVLIDSMKGIYFVDDVQIFSLHVTKCIGCGEACTVITINEIWLRYHLRMSLIISSEGGGWFSRTIVVTPLLPCPYVSFFGGEIYNLFSIFQFVRGIVVPLLCVIFGRKYI